MTQTRKKAAEASQGPTLPSPPHPVKAVKLPIPEASVPESAAKQAQNPPRKQAQNPPQNPPQNPNPAPRAERPPVRKMQFRWRHFITLMSFVFCVLLPSGGTGYYLWTIATDQYVSRVGFTVRREDTSSALELLGGLTSLSGSSSSDKDILYEFIQSQKLVADMDAAVDLRAIWSRPDFDPVFALDPQAPVEELVAYWNDMVNLSLGSGSGLLEVEVRAFTPEDATLIAQTLFDKSSDMINELSSIAQKDTIRFARDELNAAVERLKDARAVVTRFRNEHQLINPEIDLRTQAGLIGTLQAQQVETIIELDLLRETVRDGDPRLAQAERRLAVIETRIAAERDKLGVRGAGNGDQAFADIVGDYERLVVEREFAEKAYVTALAAYDGAQAEARRKSRYLAAYMLPTEAEMAEYPKRPTLLFLIALFLFLAWSVVVLVAYSIKDRR